MATILLTWELGGGLGHLTQLQPIAEGLAEQGHRVFLAIRDLSRARLVFSDRITLIQAPFKHATYGPLIRPPRTFAHILHNTGFGSDHELAALVSAWRAIFDLLKPALIVFDHSPVALLAARGLPIRRALLGAGFFCPLQEYPLRDLRPWLPCDPVLLRQQEDSICDRVNRFLADRGQSPIQYLAELFLNTDDNFLVTFKELDHYPDRPPARYWGPLAGVSAGLAPNWPIGPKRRAFAYLKNFPAASGLLKHLSRLDLSVLVYADGVDSQVLNGIRAHNVRVETQPIDLRNVPEQCEVAILNAGHGTTCQFLLKGRPVMLLPIFLEQGLLSAAVTRAQLGVDAPIEDAARATQALDALLSEPHFAKNASQFAARYRRFDSVSQREAIVERAMELASNAC